MSTAIKPPEPHPDDLLFLEEVSALTRLTVSTLRHYRHRGTGPLNFRLGRRVVARRSDVENWIAEQQRRELSS